MRTTALRTVAAGLVVVAISGCATALNARPSAVAPSDSTPAPAPPTPVQVTPDPTAPAPAPPPQQFQTQPEPSPVSPLPNWTPNDPVPHAPITNEPPRNVPDGAPIPHCGDLGPVVTTTRWEAALGSRHLFVGMLNCTDAPMTLDEAPILRAHDSAGRDRLLTLDPERQPEVRPHTVRPREWVWFHIVYSAGGSADTWEKWAHTVSFEVPGLAHAHLTDHTDLGDDSSVRVVAYGPDAASVR